MCQIIGALSSILIIILGAILVRHLAQGTEHLSLELAHLSLMILIITGAINIGFSLTNKIYKWLVNDKSKRR